jgi:ABC-2 type transport system permease protein
MLGVHAVLLGSGIVAKEETDHTAEFLFTKPRSRGKILAAKLLAALTGVVILNVVTVVASLVGMDAVTKSTAVNGDILFLMPALLGLQIYFLAVGFAFASVMRRPKRAGQWAAVVLLGTFVISSFVSVTDKFHFLKYLTAFEYFNPETIFANQKYDPVYLGIAATTVVALVVASFVGFAGRDIDT